MICRETCVYQSTFPGRDWPERSDVIEHTALLMVQPTGIGQLHASNGPL